MYSESLGQRHSVKVSLSLRLPPRDTDEDVFARIQRVLFCLFVF